jgi:hypothetical protein
LGYRGASRAVNLRVRHMQRYQWSRLNSHQKGAFAEYYVKMELTMWGFQVYGIEVDDRGIDFVARFEQRPFLEIQVKSAQSTDYVYMQKEKFALDGQRYLALVLLQELSAPALYWIPSLAWQTPNATLVERNYDQGQRSKPEYGINRSKKHREYLDDHYRFELTVAALLKA